MNPLRYIGKTAIKFYGNLVSVVLFSYHVAGSLALRGRKGRKAVSHALAMQLYFTGVQALPIVGLLAVLVGAIASFEATIILRTIGARSLVGPILSLLIVSEIGPLVVATVILVRSGTAVAAELAAMSLNDEISALRIMAINPYRFVIMPRLLGFTVSAVALSLYFGAIAIMAGWVSTIAITGNIAVGLLSTLASTLRASRFILCLLKSAVFGIIISLCSCYFGLSAKRLRTEIPQLTTKATVAGLFWCFVAAAAIAALSF